jgi:hypothetical protein
MVAEIAEASAQEAAPAAPAIAPLNLAVAIVPVVIAVGAVWLGGRRSALVKDNLLPQIAPAQQPYSLGRWQMAFWFTLIFVAFIGIYIFNGNYHTITPQALWLMGISATTGISAIAVDIIKDTPVDAANRGLKALGLQTYADVERTRQEIASREQQLKANPAPNVAQQIGLEIRDRQLLLTAYENAIAPFVSDGWYKDLTTDSNGAALHRVQTLAWTLALGVIFVIGVIANRQMPQFDSSLLLVLGISSAGYVGFKYPEPTQ